LDPQFAQVPLILGEVPVRQIPQTPLILPSPVRQTHAPD